MMIFYIYRTISFSLLVSYKLEINFCPLAGTFEEVQPLFLVRNDGWSFNIVIFMEKYLRLKHFPKLS